MAQVKRPLSPHLQVYRWGWYMAASIVHRATGTALAFGSILLAWWFVAMATGHEYFNTVQAYAGSIIGRIVLFGLTLALMQHMLSGIRHLFMDMGKLFGLRINTVTARLTFIGSVILTLVIWYAAYKVMGEI